MNKFISSSFPPGGVGGVEDEEQRRDMDVGAHLNEAEFSLYFNSVVWVLFFQEDRIQMISGENFSQNESKARSRTNQNNKALELLISKSYPLI